MKISGAALLAVAGWSLAAAPAWAVKYPTSNRVRVEVQVAVGFVLSGTAFTAGRVRPQTIRVTGPAFVYTYEVRSLPESVLDVWNVGVEVPVSVGATTFQSTSLFGYKTSLGRGVRIGPDRTAGPSWYTWTIASHPELNGPSLRPGESVGGLFFASAGLPGIRAFQAWGWIYDQLPKVEDLEEEGPNTGLGVENPEAMNPATSGFRTVAVGPDVRPETLSTAQMADRLIKLKDDVAGMGWIKDPGTVTSLNQKLKNARKQLDRWFGGKKAAGNILMAFTQELDAQRGKHVNENAYQLLRANAEFLIWRLGGVPPAR